MSDQKHLNEQQFAMIYIVYFQTQKLLKWLKRFQQIVHSCWPSSWNLLPHFWKSFFLKPLFHDRTWDAVRKRKANCNVLEQEWCFALTGGWGSLSTSGASLSTIHFICYRSFFVLISYDTSEKQLGLIAIDFVKLSFHLCIINWHFIAFLLAYVLQKSLNGVLNWYSFGCVAVSSFSL